MPKSGLYIQLFSLHGLIRGEDIELGRDADTGGQVKYVLEIAKHLGEQKGIRKIDLFTRRIIDKNVSSDYSQAVEKVSEKVSIIRIQCGGKRYVRKEMLWPHLDEYVDKVVTHIKKTQDMPDVIHSHYADAGYVGLHLSKFFNIPHIHTGHSLGKDKKQKLTSAGVKPEIISKRYHLDKRIDVEEEVYNQASAIITSTNQEIEKQYGLYSIRNESKFAVIPPGIDLDIFYPYYHEDKIEDEDDEERELRLQARSTVVEELKRFFMIPEKPTILSICRPDKRKNIPGLIEAFGENKELQAIANLAIFAGIRRDISHKEDNEREVLVEILMLMDKYDLYGKLAIPKKHDFTYEIPELYRVVAEGKGVFVNSALFEPFGLTLIEAASCGLPIVSTQFGGPQDIIKNCRNGVLVDVTKKGAIAKELRKILSHEDLWKKYSNNGIRLVREHYSWESHCKKYLSVVRKICKTKTDIKTTSKSQKLIGKRMAHLEKLVVLDIDDTLLGDPDALKKLSNLLRKHVKTVGFCVASGRTSESSLKVLREHKVPDPDIVISDVGSEIYYGSLLSRDQGWAAHISKNWDKEKIIELLKEFGFLKLQSKAAQKEYKISYFMDSKPHYLVAVNNHLNQYGCGYHLIYSHQKYLDILPYRASKGKALKYLANKWDIPLKNILTAGNSGNDASLLTCGAKALVVGNYNKELDYLRKSKKVYFSEECYGAGILDGIRHYKFLG
ncbi:HAD-IIB family hydrolase [Candidatus Margulisiibacteriota bacterium]